MLRYGLHALIPRLPDHLQHPKPRAHCALHALSFTAARSSVTSVRQALQGAVGNPRDVLGEQSNVLNTCQTSRVLQAQGASVFT